MCPGKEKRDMAMWGFTNERLRQGFDEIEHAMLSSNTINTHDKQWKLKQKNDGYSVLTFFFHFSYKTCSASS